MDKRKKKKQNTLHLMSYKLTEETRPKLCSLIVRPQHRSILNLEEFLSNKKALHRLWTCGRASLWSRCILSWGLKDYL